MRLKTSDWIVISIFYFLTMLPLIIYKMEVLHEYYFMSVLMTGFFPIYITHTTPVGLKFRKFYFSILWLLLILINGLLYASFMNIWPSMITSFAFYHLLRQIFKKVNKEDPIPIYVGPGTNLEFNKIENRKENKKDGLFTIISFFGGFGFSIGVAILTN